MTTATTPVTKLVCSECRHENEPERIYCHECGSRLARSAIRIQKEPIQDTHKRVRRMFNPQRAKLRALATEGVKLILGAGFIALVIVMFLSPELPAPVKGATLVSLIRFDLESMVNKHQPPRREFTEEQANTFLASALKTKHARVDKPYLSFKRAVLTFQEQSCAVTVERAVGRYWSVYTSCTYVPQLKAGNLSAQIIAARIGRLPVHPKLAQYMGVL